MLKCIFNYLIFLVLNTRLSLQSFAPITSSIAFKILPSTNFYTEFFTVNAYYFVSWPLISFIVMIGVVIFLVLLIISLMRGTPWVIFILEIPAKWKVFRVIWVAGSPILWAVRAPIASPGYIKALFIFFTYKLKKYDNCLSVIPLKQFL